MQAHTHTQVPCLAHTALCVKSFMKESRGYLEIAGKTQRDGILQILIKELGALVNVNLKYVPLLL